MSGLLKEIEERRAKRAITDQEVPADVIGRLMSAATLAPSCHNSQPWRFMVVTEQPGLEKLHESLTGGNYWAKKAPLLVVVATKTSFDAKLSDGREYALFGCGLATENLLLQAVKEGLYAHPMAGFDPLMVKKAFKIPDDYIVINIVAIGYPGSFDGLSEKHVVAEQSERERKPAEMVICHNSWSFE
ncbi:MAG: nitroreductase family protein [Desulforhopalus sp.]